MKISYFLACISISLILSSSQVLAKNSLEILVQPYLTLSENGSWSKEAEAEPGIHRAKLAYKMDRKILKDSEIKARLSIDVAEKNFNDILKNAYVSFEPLKQLNFQAGKFKVPFGSHYQISSNDLNSIYRSYSTGHIINNLNISGYQYGFIIYGNLHKMFSYNAGIFKFSNNKIDGFHIKDLFDFPVLSLNFNPFDLLKISYQVAIPQAGTLLEDGEVLYNRFLFHDISLNLKTKNKLYETLLNSFIGIDTSEVKEAQLLFKNYGENIAFSIFSNHTFNINLPKKFTLSLTTGFEYLNGLNWGGSENYLNRSYYFALSEDLQLKYKNKFFIQFSYDTRLDDKFDSIHENRFTAQVTYYDEFNLTKKK